MGNGRRTLTSVPADWPTNAPERNAAPLVDRLPPRLLRTFDVKRMPLRAKDFELVSRSVPGGFRGGSPQHSICIHLRVRPSQRVLALALPVIDGPDSLPDGSAVHIRRGDRGSWSARRAEDPSRARCLRRINGVLSVERARSGVLGRVGGYHTVRFMDYPHLVELVSAQGRPPGRGGEGDHAPRTHPHRHPARQGLDGQNRNACRPRYVAAATTAVCPPMAKAATIRRHVLTR